MLMTFSSYLKTEEVEKRQSCGLTTLQLLRPLAAPGPAPQPRLDFSRSRAYLMESGFHLRFYFSVVNRITPL